MSKIIVITSALANLQVVNRLLLNLRDWEFGEEETWDHCEILQSIEGAQFPARIPLQKFAPTEFVGKSVEEVESIMLTMHKNGDASKLFLLLDDEGVRNQTIIVAENAVNPDENGDLYLNQFNKVRVPWIEAHAMWCNLDIANMSFEDFCHEEEPTTDSRWFTYRNMMGDDHYKPFMKRRDIVLRELAKLDLA